MKLNSVFGGAAWTLIACGLWLASGASSYGKQSLPLTVVDVIRQWSFTQFDAIELTGNEKEKGLGLAAVMHRGNPDRQFTEYSLVFVPMSDLLRFVNIPRARSTAPEVLTRFETGSPEPAIQQLKWHADRSQLTFLGFRKEASDLGQIYRFDFSRRRLEQLTHSPLSIKSYAISADGEVVVYSALAAPIRSGAAPQSYVIGASRDARNGVATTMTAKPDDRPEVAYFTLNLRNGKTQRLETNEPPHWLNMPRTVYISPSGRWAVRRVSLSRMPDSWTAFQSVKALYDTKTSVLGWRSSEQASGGLPRKVMQFQLIDLEQGLVRPLVDAPCETAESGLLDYQDGAVAWSVDRQNVIVAGTHLPLSRLPPAERDRATDSIVIAEIDLQSGRVQRIADIDMRRARPRLTAEPGGMLSVSVDTGKGQEWTRFRKDRGHWEQIDRYSVESPAVLRSGEFQNLSGVEPVRIAAGSVNTPETSSALKIVDLNSGSVGLLPADAPLFPKYEGGAVERLNWKDKTGATIHGGTVVPGKLEKFYRYPLVIQVYGFDESAGYMFDNGLPAYPGRLLVDRGIMVLQANCLWQESQEVMRQRWGSVEFGRFRSFTACIDSAIDELTSRAWIDPNRVGIIGFSANGNYAYNTVTFSEHPIAAAIIADSVQASLWTYLIVYGDGSMKQWDTLSSESFIGSRFFGAGMSDWLERSPMFHLDRIRTPLLFEYHGSNGSTYPSPSWDTYAILKREERPVDMVYFPEGAHNLTRPAEQWVSREGTLDWFSFWLKGDEDPDPSKYKQYDRWRLLKRQQAAHLDELVKAGADRITLPALTPWEDPKSKEPGSPADIRARQKLGRIIAAPNGRIFVYEWMRPYNWTREKLGRLNRKTTERDQAWLYHVDLTPESYAPYTSQYLFIPLPRATYWLGSFSPDSTQLSFYELDYDTNTVTMGVWRKSDDTVVRFALPADDAKVTQPPQWVSDDEIVYPGKNGTRIRASLSTGTSVVCADCAFTRSGTDEDLPPATSHKPQIADPALQLVARTPNGEVDIYKKDTPGTLGLVLTRDWLPEPIVVFENMRR